MTARDLGFFIVGGLYLLLPFLIGMLVGHYLTLFGAWP